eukprot:CAMPEP_0197251014 /NCGR_PEP_ID=MMETSP1429-20130617/55361_1 /TAXON_ID=49237 /ORGANISM="Chaetoceros  sp., Strain UNC1202" /LENGTH=50 /DNA_ID=CAMNT_0042712985 /DNA_START=12 /DNA_END=161 /DNA_ORIENTATION=-
MIYRPLHGGIGSLADSDPSWYNIERPDSTGFCGVYSLALSRGETKPHRFE